MTYLLGYDLGSSFVKVALLAADSGRGVAAAAAPAAEMRISVPRPGWAEQDPARWWAEVVAATAQLRARYPFDPAQVAGIGLTYQMHGLVLLDRAGQVLRPAIIWCDSRAVALGQRAFAELGEAYCLENFLNSPGNFTASKLRWVRENEPAVYARIHKVLLPGDYLAYRLTGQLQTTVSGLSEGVLWNFRRQAVAQELLDYYDIKADLLPDVVDTFGVQGHLSAAAAAALGLTAGTPLSYRAGDQPNNAFSLNVLHPGEVAATAGTSGVVYGISAGPAADPRSRVNSFVHVNHTPARPRHGVLLCLNGTGSLNRWLRGLVGELSYDEMNRLAAQAPVGAGGLRFLPFGNGAERLLENRPAAAELRGLDFNVHGRAHVLRAAQEGIVFALAYGLDLLRGMGVPVHTVRAGRANLFRSPVFREAFVNSGNVALELYDTDGAQGAARGAGLGAGVYASPTAAFDGLERLLTVAPTEELRAHYHAAATDWRQALAPLVAESTPPSHA